MSLVLQLPVSVKYKAVRGLEHACPPDSSVDSQLVLFTVVLGVVSVTHTGSNPIGHMRLV